MLDFFHAVTQYTFVLNALLTGILASVACGMVGSFVVARRITYIAGGIAHSVLGGMGVARWLELVNGWPVKPLYGAVAAALAAALTIGVVSLKAREREDTVIGAIWAIGMAVGILFIAATPGYNEDLMSYLFGNILMVGPVDLWLIGGLDLGVMAVTLLFFNQLQAVCFDEEFARVRGLNVEAYYLLLLGLTALTVVILVTVVGIVLVIALLTLPVAVAGYFARTLGRIMAASIGLSILFTVAGLAASFGPNLPAGAMIIMAAGGSYLAVVAATRLRRAIR